MQDLVIMQHNEIYKQFLKKDSTFDLYKPL